MQIFPAIITTKIKRKKGHWKKQLKEVNKFKIKKIGLFLTGIGFNERNELYKELEKSCVNEIVLIHLRHDFREEEINYFFNKFKTRLFNCHEQHINSFYKKFAKYKKLIFMELNADNVIKTNIEPTALCVDLTHLYLAKIRNAKEYEYSIKRKVKVNHLNGFNTKTQEDSHFIKNKSQFNFLKEIPKKMISNTIVLEMENTIKKQLEYKEYLLKLLS